MPSEPNHDDPIVRLKAVLTRAERLGLKLPALHKTAEVKVSVTTIYRWLQGGEFKGRSYNDVCMSFETCVQTLEDAHIARSVAAQSATQREAVSS